MGLDAYVQCNCIKEGKVKKAPFDINLLTCNEGVYELSDLADDATFYQYHNWSKDACEHRNGYYIFERVSNASGSNFLWSVIESVGEGKFPVIRSIWCVEKIHLEEVKRGILELEILKSKINEIEGSFLIDEKTGEEYWQVLVGKDSWFYSHGRIFNYNLGDRGFYITDQDDKVIFESKDFIQEVILKDMKDIEYSVSFKDIVTGNIYKSLKAIEKCINWDKKEFYFPERLVVIRRKLKVSDIPALEVLEKLFKVSIQCNNPIVLI